MSSNLMRTQTPEEKELAKKLAELTVLESDLAQRELDVATLRAEAAHDKIKNQIVAKQKYGQHGFDA